MDRMRECMLQAIEDIMPITMVICIVFSLGIIFAIAVGYAKSEHKKVIYQQERDQITHRHDLELKRLKILNECVVADG